MWNFWVVFSPRAGATVSSLSAVLPPVPSRTQGSRPFCLSAAARAVLGTWGGDEGKQKLTLKDVAELLRKKECRRVVVMAGAGISTPSGIPDFR